MKRVDCGGCRILFRYVCSPSRKIRLVDGEGSVGFMLGLSNWGSFWEIQIARTACERRALSIVGLLHIWESNPSAPLICLVGVVEHP